MLVVWVPARQARRRDKAAEGVGVGDWATGWEGEGSGPRRDDAVGMLVVVLEVEGGVFGDISCYRNKLPRTPPPAHPGYNITSRDCQAELQGLSAHCGSLDFTDEHEY